MKTDPEQTEVERNNEQDILAQRLREAREYLGLSQELVAERLNIPRPAISAIETGKRKVSSSELKQFAHLYKRSVDFFLGIENVDEAKDDLLKALYRELSPLNETDRQQVLQFASFLRHAGKPPTLKSNKPQDEDVSK